MDDNSQKGTIGIELAHQIEELFKTDRKKFLGFIRQRVRSQEEAEDILQDVFTNVLAASSSIQKPIENIASWVFTAVRNRIIDSYRKKRAEAFSEMQTPGQAEEGGDMFENFLGDVTASPESNMMQQSIWDEINKGLDELPDEQKEVFVKNEFEGISFREMSEQTGVNINTLLARKRYAVLHLRRKLKDIYESLQD
ncbi:MAG: sigma-70 family RNA polymerase sigma factor [bacterium]|jgi:RNA polymerase sigma factor (sigma-70 family)